MTAKSDFAEVTRRGRKSRSGALVIYLLAASPAVSEQPSRIGLVVGKSVGGSVVRHQVSRRLRAQLAQRLGQVPEGSRVVVRALPESATAASSTLGTELDKAFARLVTGPRS